MTLNTKQDGGFVSRKFLVTMTGMALATLLALADKMSGDVAIVLGAGIGAYNWANLRESESMNR